MPTKRQESNMATVLREHRRNIKNGQTFTKPREKKNKGGKK